ncbi:TIM barrel protein [Granulosicoccaceae sp. 1_MG-2023]|nr:TIM barrel protein [Granulosicoccaceae sp. 1_MG-2023]
MLFAAANLSFLFPDVPFPARFSAARAAGFSAVEYLFPYAMPVADIRRHLSDNALKQVLFNLPPGNWEGGERGLACLPQQRAAFRDSVALAREYAAGLNCTRLHCMAGVCPDDSDPLYRQTYLDNLAYAATELGGDGIVLLIEAINREDMPGYFLSDLDQAAAIVAGLRDSGIDNIALQFDLYHCAKMHGDVVSRLQKYAHLTEHFQIAGCPERNEPDTGQVDFQSALKQTARLAPGRYLGFEYKPVNDTVQGLQWMKSLAAAVTF